MQRFGLSSVMLLLLLLALGLALPTLEENGSLAPRAQFCANAPNTVAGTSKLNHRSPLSNTLRPRKNAEAVVWCAYDSQTYIILTMVYEVGGDAIETLLSAAYDEIMTTLDSHGDGVIPGGIFQKLGAGHVMLRTMNSNNHQVTYGVLGAAISALEAHMSQFFYGAASFTINDGLNEVAKGVIGIE